MANSSRQTKLPRGIPRPGRAKPRTDSPSTHATFPGPADESALHAWAEHWFNSRGWSPFPFQRQVWNAYAGGQSGLIHAATGTGKTYAAWWAVLEEAFRERRTCESEQIPAEPLRALWVTPLRALASDTLGALVAPIADLGLPWTVETRTGDTPASIRSRQRSRLPTALVTTPESLTLLLARDDSRTLFSNLRSVIVDEWHELLASKRGIQVELALARLRSWRPELRTWGLSATLGNLSEALAALVGVDPRHPPLLVEGHHAKQIVIDSIAPETMERFPWAGHLGLVLLPQVLAALDEVKSALVFTNTRSQTEQWYQAILKARPEWAGTIALHHGSLDRRTRDWVEQGLRSGSLRCVVCTSSLDLGVDFSPVERVLQIGSPKGVARLLQRAGRSGHQPDGTSRVTCVPTHALELIEVAAAREAAQAGRIESRVPCSKALDVLAQHLVTIAVGGGFRADELLQEVRSSHAYRDLTEEEWSWILDFVTRGGEPLKAYPDFRRVEVVDGLYQVVSPATARRHRMAIGTIVGEASIQVQYLRGPKLGTVEESFIARLKPGDSFIFAGRSLELVRVRDLKAWVRKASKPVGVVPRWNGGRMPLSTELSSAVRDVLQAARAGQWTSPEMRAVQPILGLQARWSRIPAVNELLIEEVRTREGHHTFIYPFEGRLVHEGLAALFAYRLARRKAISFTLAANDYGFELLSADQPPLKEVLSDGLLQPGNLAEDLMASLNAAELSRRQFREIARVAGLVSPGFPGSGKTARQLTASSGLFFDVFSNFDPGNLLLRQAEREVLDRQLEESRIKRVLDRLTNGVVTVVAPPRPSPFAFPLLVDRLRETLSSEALADRVRKMQIEFERDVR